MRVPAGLFSISFALGVTIFVPETHAQFFLPSLAGPTAIRQCREIGQPGSYVLANNLSGGQGCLIIRSSSVTIELAGFSISGGVQDAVAVIGPPVESPLLQGIVLRNGSISNSNTGVNFGDAASVTVEGLSIFNNEVGIVASGIVRNNNVSRNHEGIFANGIVTGNYVSSNVGRGIIAGPGSSLIGNVANGNGIGLFVTCPANLIENTAIDNSEVNLRQFGSCQNINNLAP